MLGDVEPAGAVRIVISTAEELAEDGVVSVYVCACVFAFASRCSGEGNGRGEGRKRETRSALCGQGTHGDTRAEGEDVRLLHALGLNVPAGEVVLQHADETFFWVVARLRAAQP